MTSSQRKAVKSQLSESMKRRQKRCISFITFVKRGALAEYAKSAASLCTRGDIIGRRVRARMEVIENAFEDVTSWYSSIENVEKGTVRCTV